MVQKALATTIILLIAAMPAFAQKGGKIKWQKNPYAALKEGKTRGLPVLLYFTSDG